jgi:integrase/recombinase XerD
MRNQLNVDWSRETKKSDLEPALRGYERYLVNLGFRDSTIAMYVFRAGKYLEFAKTDQPLPSDFDTFREVLLERRLSRSTLNHYGLSIRKYHEMIKQPITFPFLKPNDTIPYFSNEQDIAKILIGVHNLKHYCMLMVMFYGCLRVSDLCNLTDPDIDFEAKTIRIREGMGGPDPIVPLNPAVIPVLRDYLKIRPSFKVNGEQPLL